MNTSVVCWSGSVIEASDNPGARLGVDLKCVFGTIKN